MRTRHTTLLALLVTLLAATGCTRAVPGEPVTAWNADRAIAEATEKLAAAGIAVHTDPEDPQPRVPPAEPVSPMWLLAWQVRAMALEADRHGGIAAADLNQTADGVTVEPAVALTPADVIAGWARYGETPAAGYARELLGDAAEHPETAVFPQLVLALFASDLAVAGTQVPPVDPPSSKPPATGKRPTATPRPTPPPTTEHTSTPAPTTPAPSTVPAPTPTAEAPPAATPMVEPAMFAAQARPCSAVLNFVDGVIAAVFDRIGHLANLPQLTEGTGLLGRLGQLVNAIGKVLVGGANLVIDGARFVISNGVRVAIAPIMAAVARIAGIAGAIAQIVSAIRPWTLVMTAEPATNRKAIGTESPLPGKVTARVDLGGLDDWPPFVADCAQQAGVTLPALKPAGNPVTWTLTGTTPDLFGVDDQQATLDAASAATATYHTAVEPRFRNPTEAVGHLQATATVQRDDMTQLQEALTRLLRDGLASLVPPVGEVVAPLVLPFVQPLIAKAFDALAHLRDVRNTIAVPITYHTGDEEEPEPEPGDTPTGATPTGEPPPGAAPLLPKSCPPPAEVAGAAGVQFDVVSGGPGLLLLPILASLAVACTHSYKLPPDSDDVIHGGVNVEIGYSSSQDIVAQLERTYGPCQPTSVAGATRACLVPAVNGNTYYVVVATERSHAVVAAQASYDNMDGVNGPPPWVGKGQAIAMAIAAVVTAQLRGLR